VGSRYILFFNGDIDSSTDRNNDIVAGIIFTGRNTRDLETVPSQIVHEVFKAHGRYTGFILDIMKIFLHLSQARSLKVYLLVELTILNRVFRSQRIFPLYKVSQKFVLR